VSDRLAGFFDANAGSVTVGEVKSWSPSPNVVIQTVIDAAEDTELEGDYTLRLDLYSDQDSSYNTAGISIPVKFTHSP
jgi:hypothetical protein